MGARGEDYAGRPRLTEDELLRQPFRFPYPALVGLNSRRIDQDLEPLPHPIGPDGEEDWTSPAAMAYVAEALIAERYAPVLAVPRLVDPPIFPKRGKCLGCGRHGLPLSDAGRCKSCYLAARPRLQRALERAEAEHATRPRAAKEPAMARRKRRS